MNSNAMGGKQTREVTEIGLHPFMLAYANRSGTLTVSGE